MFIQEVMIMIRPVNISHNVVHFSYICLFIISFCHCVGLSIEISSCLINPITQQHTFIVIANHLAAVPLNFILSLPSVCSCCCYTCPSTSPTTFSLCTFSSFIISSASSACQSQQSHQLFPPQPVSTWKVLSWCCSGPTAINHK